MKFRKGDLVVVRHQRSGKWNGIVQEDFDDAKEEFPVIAVAPGSKAIGMNNEWEPGECPPCRKGLCEIDIMRGIEKTDIKHVPIEKWGKDHWAVFAYIESLAVDNKGLAVPDPQKMRTNRETHAATGGGISPFGIIMDGAEYPTRLNKGTVKGHDDWDCLDDAATEGLLQSVGSMVNPAYKLTDVGLLMATKLRKHRMNGGTFSKFMPK